MKRMLILAGFAAALAACGGRGAPATPPSPPVEQPPDVVGGGGPATATKECADVFAQDLLPTYRVEISPQEWAKLEDEFLHREQREAMGLDVHPWHPIVFRYGDEVIDTAMIRLHGMSSWLLAIALDPRPKMQFVISFNELDGDARFHGLRKIVLDMPRNDWTFLRQRLALSFLRDDLGLPAQCANNARLEINGAYYGLYTNLERLDREFLRRNFPGEDGGDLWESGRELKNNERTADLSRRRALYSATTLSQVAPLADLDAALEEWAGEAMLPDSDGYYGGNDKNYYLYDHPRRGFIWLPYDLDGTFVDFAPADLDPYLWSRRQQLPLHYRLTLANAGRMAQYVDDLSRAHAAYDVPRLQQRITAWAAQIAQAAEQDPNRPFPMANHRRKLSELSAFLHERSEFVAAWIECRRRGGADPDGDGAAWCLDCAEGDASVHPGSAEVPGNGLDDSCDGRIDEAP